ncbi:hypothetical protein N7490_000312 [Penicillium lividum]|nr:hypothetical protein N7490_000312 [Penicillium lividum]
MDIQKTISSQVGICRAQFHSLLESGDLQQFESTVALSQWKDELGRFRVWISNIGAHQTCQLSLEYRLRDASHIKSQVKRQLGRLHRLLVDLQDIAEEESDLEMPDGEPEVDPTEEVQLIYSDLLHIIKQLYEMSILIRKPSSHDRLRQIQKSDYSDFVLNDRQHVYAKFPYADHDTLDRLGVANSKRRALLKYREKHRQKFGYGVDGGDRKTTALSESIATEFKDSALHSWDAKSESDKSMTSYGSLTIDGDQEIADLKPPENAMAGQPFECGLCCHIVQTRDRKSWMRHVFSDLMPYVCIYPDCKTPDRLYERRHQWVKHLESHHPPSFDLPPSVDIVCPLCQKKVNRGSTFDEHLGRHLENLSLFAVPRSLSQNWSDPTLEDETHWRFAAAKLEDRQSSEVSNLQGLDGNREFGPPLENVPMTDDCVSRCREKDG